VCNDYRLEVPIASILEDFDDLEIKIDLPEGTPNVAAREDIKISDIPADGFFEFGPPIEPGQKRKTKYLFTLKDHDWLCIAGIWRSHPEVGEAFTMLTMEPGEDVAPYHARQIIPLTRDQWVDWLDLSVPAEVVLRVLPKGSLPVTRVFPPMPEPTLL